MRRPPPSDFAAPISAADPVARDHPLNRGRLGWWLTLPWLMGGSRWADLMGLRPGTLTNMTTAASGWRPTTRPGGWGHLQFDGTDDAVSIPAAIPLQSPLTVSAWIKAVSSATNRVIVGFGTTVSGAAAQLRLTTADKLQYTTYDGVTFLSVTSTSVVADGTWRHVALTRVGGTTQLYVDGLPDGSSLADTLSYTTNALDIGRVLVGGAANLPFLGSIDDVGVLARALSAAEFAESRRQSWAGYPGVMRHSPGPAAAAPVTLPPLGGGAASGAAAMLMHLWPRPGD